jgi:pyruvate dehydrogenase E2 component (dihydrolipoamide acetyltransferase)
MKPINMPQVGQDIPTARIVEWTKPEGDAVQKGEVLAVVESDKATFEVQAEQAGVLLKIVVPAGAEGEVFKPIAWLGQPGEQFPADSPGGVPSGASRPAPAQPTVTEAAFAPAASERQLASPAVRRVAREQGVDLNAVKGTGPGGRILKEDVVAAAATGECTTPNCVAVQASKPPTESGIALADRANDEVIPFTRMRQRIAERLLLSKQTIPHFHLRQDVDMTEAQQWRQAFNPTNGSRVTVTDLILYATSRALAEFRRLNAHVDKDRLFVRQTIDVGVATAVEDGLLVPVIPDTDKKDLLEISRLSKQNAEAARRGVVDPSVQGTFTVSSLGQFGIPSFLPIINPPECAILAVGAILPRIVPIAGGIGVRQMMSLSLACDHRAVDGAYAARFLARLKELIETTWRPAENKDTSTKGPHESPAL